jgi:hypothetical protein
MNGDEPTSPDPLDFPRNWDVIRDDPPAIEEQEADGGSQNHGRPPVIAVMAASWADLVTAAAVCTSALLALVLLGYQPSPEVVPWAAALGAVWWAAAASATALIRHRTPGMVLAGISFKERIRPGRVPLVVAVAAVQALLLGLPAALGPRRSPLALAARSPMETSSHHSPPT